MKPNPSLSLTGLSLAVTVLWASLASTAAATVEGNLQKTFTVSAGGKLVVDADLGSIEVTTAKSPQVAIQVFREATAASEAKARELLAEHRVDFLQEGNTVTVRAKGRQEWSGLWNLFHSRFDVRFVIAVPETFDVDLKTAGGSIRVADLTGAVKARTSGGSLKLGQIRGPVQGHTSGGSIHVAGCQGSVRVETSGGGIEIGEGNGDLAASTSGGSIHLRRFQGDVRVHTSGGGITAEQVEGNLEATTSGGSISAVLARQPTGNCRLETSGGNITVKLPPTAALNVEARTSGGRVTTELPVATTVVGEQPRTRLEGKLNGGGQDLVLHTSGGSIHLQKL